MIELMPVLIGAGSLLVGVITFILTEISKSKRAIRSEIRQWQLDTIGAILSSQDSTVADFGKVRTKYLENANAFKEFNIPKAYMQDNEIRRALFELQAKGIVLQDNDGNYRLRKEATESETEKRFAQVDERQKKIMDDVMRSIMDKVQEQQKTSAEWFAQQQSENVAKLIEAMKKMQLESIELVQAQERRIETYFNEEKMHKEIQKSALEMVAENPGKYTYDDALLRVVDATKHDSINVSIQLINLVTSGILAVDANRKLRIALHQIKAELHELQ